MAGDQERETHPTPKQAALLFVSADLKQLSTSLSLSPPPTLTHHCNHFSPHAVLFPVLLLLLPHHPTRLATSLVPFLHHLSLSSRLPAGPLITAFPTTTSPWSPYLTVSRIRPSTRLGPSFPLQLPHCLTLFLPCISSPSSRLSLHQARSFTSKTTPVFFDPIPSVVQTRRSTTIPAYHTIECPRILGHHHHNRLASPCSERSAVTLLSNGGALSPCTRPTYYPPLSQP